MGPNDRRARERLDTRTTILDAAREMFAQQGLEAVTMRAIAREIEYTPTAIYHHFRDKNDLITELVHQDFNALAGAFQKIGRVENPVERIRQTGVAYADFGLTHRSHYRVMFMIQTPAPMKTDGRGNPEEDAYAFLQHAVREGVDGGHFRAEYTNVDMLAQVIWAGIHGIISLQIAKCNDPWIEWADIRESVLMAIDVTLRGVVREPAAHGLD